MSFLKYFLHKANNKGLSSSSPSSLSVLLPTGFLSLSSRKLEVTNEFIEKAITATSVSTTSYGKYNQYTPKERAVMEKYTAKNGPT